MVSRFDPILPSYCKLIKVPYVPKTVARVEDEILGEYDYPTGLWEKVKIEICETKRERYRKKEFPIAIFSAGLNTTRLFSLSLTQEIASHGFTVVLVDHPYDTDVVEFPNGDIIYGNRVLKPVNGNTTSVEFALEVRALDVSFVLNTLGVGKKEKVVMFGHSFGGAATATTMLHDSRVKGGINLDGMMFGPVLNTSLGSPSDPRAFVLWGSDGHNTTTDATWTQFWDELEASKYVYYDKEMSITDSIHGSFWDLNYLVDITGIRDSLSDLARSGVGPIPGARIWEIMSKYVPAFFWFALELKPEDAVFKGPSELFPDVVILRK